MVKIILADKLAAGQSHASRAASSPIFSPGFVMRTCENAMGEAAGEKCPEAYSVSAESGFASSARGVWGRLGDRVTV